MGKREKQALISKPLMDESRSEMVAIQFVPRSMNLIFLPFHQLCHEILCFVCINGRILPFLPHFQQGSHMSEPQENGRQMSDQIIYLRLHWLVVQYMLKNTLRESRFSRRVLLGAD